MKKILSIIVIGILFISGFGTAVTTNFQSKKMTIQQEIQFSEPVITNQNNYSSAKIKEATSYVALPGNPMLPVYTKLFMFPFGTIIKGVSFTTSSEQIKELTNEILPAAQPTPVSGGLIELSNEKQVKNDLVYLGTNTYPLSRLDYQIGAGLNGNEHVILLSIQYYPLLYLPQHHTLLFTPNVQITVTYEQSKNS